MSEQLDRIEAKLEKLALAVERRLTAVETTQRGMKWLIGIVTAAATATVIAL